MAEEGPDHPTEAQPIRVKLLGPLAIALAGRSVGPWPRPTAKRLCELVFVSPGRRVSRDLACEELFAGLSPRAAARALSKALSLARGVLSELGEPAATLLRADLSSIWANPGVALEVDYELHEQALHAGLAMASGLERDEQLRKALSEEGVLLEDEPYADWALRPREVLGALRQYARLVLARDRARGAGHCRPGEVVEAWESCLGHDPACEEAAAALVRAYSAQGLRQLCMGVYERCREALAALGLRTSPALDELLASATAAPAPARAGALGAGQPVRLQGGPKLVSVLFAELVGELGLRPDPEELLEAVGGALAGVINEVESLGGTVTSVSGAGLQAVFGAPEAHEDDPERAVRAAFHVLAARAPGEHPPALRIGIETGPALLGQVGAGATAGYGAVGEVVGIAALLQSVARAGSVLVGPATCAVTEGIFEWGPTEELLPSPDAKPLVARYLEGPTARAPARRDRLGGRGPLVGRQAEMATLGAALREVEAGRGSVVLVVGEPGLGKTRLVQECRTRFMAWAGAASGRLPLWLEGRGASYASSTPYSVYQAFLANWVGVAADAGEEELRPALERALVAVMGDRDLLPFVARVMGLVTGAETARLGPEELRRAIFGALRSVVSRLVAVGPTVLVLEDLHWADPTSLALTGELATLSRDGPLLVLATRRPEPDPGASALESSLRSSLELSFRTLELSALPADAEVALARSLLGVGTPASVIESVRAGAEGNPLFLEERLFSLLGTGALVKDGTGWRLDEGAHAEVPEVLERIVRARVDRLGPAERETLVAASVLGAEFSLAELRAVSPVDSKLDEVLSELCAGGLLAEAPQPGRAAYRFRHALIQEATYKGLLKARRRALHAAAAWALEEASADRLDEVAGVLARHHSAAGETARALHYFEIAADHAGAVFANEEAVSFYRSGLAIIGPGRPHDDAMAQAAVELRVKLGEVLWKMGSGNREAREVLHEAIGLVGPNDAYQAARAYNLLGRVEITDFCYKEATAAFDAAAALLADSPDAQGQESVELWLEVQLEGRAQTHQQREETAELAALLAEVRPVVEARGGPAQRKAFYTALFWQQTTERRWRIDEEILANARAALAAAEEGCGDYEVGWRLAHLGHGLHCHGDLDEAEGKLTLALGIAKRIGDPRLSAYCRVGLNFIALHRHDTAAVASLASQALEAAETASWPDYAALAKAFLTWLAWREGRLAEVETRANEALALWAHPWYCRWICLWPLTAVRLAKGQTAEAMAAARQILAPPQMRLPDELEAVIASAVRAWDNGDHELARAELARAVEMAEQMRYL